MDAMTDRLNAILQDPEAMARIQSLASSMFGSGGPPAPTPSPSVPVPDVPAPPAAAPAVPPEMLSVMTRLAPMLQNMRRDTPDTQLLRALRPLLSPVRQKRLDEALKLMQMMSVLPMLQRSGLLGSLL